MLYGLLTLNVGRYQWVSGRKKDKKISIKYSLIFRLISSMSRIQAAEITFSGVFAWRQKIQTVGPVR